MKKFSAYQITMIGIMAALLCIMGPLSVPIGPVPVSLSNLAIYIGVCLLGPWEAVFSCAVYIVLGMAGLPVFSGFSGGLAKLAGPTGGYIIGYLFLAFVAAAFCKKSDHKIVWTAVGMVLGTALEYAFGTVWFMVSRKQTFAYAMSVCVVPFIPFDLGKMVVALILGFAVYQALKKAKLMKE